METQPESKQFCMIGAGVKVFVDRTGFGVEAQNLVFGATALFVG